MGKGHSVIKNIFYIFQIADSWTYLACSIFHACLSGFKNSVLIIYFVQTFLDRVESKDTMKNLMFIIAGFALIYLIVTLICLYFENYYKPQAVPLVNRNVCEKLYRHSMESDLGSFDDGDFYNNYIFVMQDMEKKTIEIIDDFSQMIRNIVVTILIANVFLAMNAVVMLAIMLSVGLTVFFYFHIIKINYQKDMAILPSQRKSEYLKRVFYLKDYAKELRMTEISKLLMEQFSENAKEIFRHYKRYGLKLMFINTINGLTISLLLDIGLMLLLSYQLMVSRTITLGDFTASGYGIWSLFFSLNGLMFGFNRMPEHSLRIQKMADFFNTAPKVYQAGKDIPRKAAGQGNQPVLQLKNIGFSYHVNEKMIIHNLSLTIRAGEKIAIVGENGSGKSTLIKLILGLYEPTQGEILLNGQNLKDIDITAYHCLFASVFQDYALFSASVAQNVALGLEFDREQVKAALNKSLFLADDSHGKISLDQTLTKEFDDQGIVLSGGRSQKLIIARAFLDKEFALMDEPSSALDVTSETMLNDIILDHPSEQATVIISHRLAAAVRADRIIVLSQGEILEEGSHLDLIKKDGLYARMFRIQAEKYMQT